MTDATDLAKRLREWASRLDDACGPHESLVLLDSSADLLESQAARIAAVQRELAEATDRIRLLTTFGLDNWQKAMAIQLGIQFLSRQSAAQGDGGTVHEGGGDAD